MIIDFTINIQDAFHSTESLPCEILAPIWNLFILQNDQLWGFPSLGEFCCIFKAKTFLRTWQRGRNTINYHWVALPHDSITLLITGMHS